jgi:hypothetical protein
MSQHRKSRAVAVVLFGLAVSGACVAACGDHDKGFDDTAGHFDQDASRDSATCFSQCSLDGRSIVSSCTGETLETCPPELACGEGVCKEPCAAAAANRSSNGCEFYFQPLYASGHGHDCYAAFVVNSSNSPVNLALDLKGAPLDISKSVYRTNAGDATLLPHDGPVAVGESVVVFVADGPVINATDRAHCPQGVIPATATEVTPSGTGLGSSFHLTTSMPVSLTAIYPFGGAPSFIPSATLLLPVPTWGTQHIVVNAWERSRASGNQGGPAAQIVASEDDTDVTIRPTHAIQTGGGVAGTAALVPVTYHLDKGQVLQLSQAEELSGSVVMSTKPTSVFGGHECMNIPSGRYACDAALQELPSFEQWGSEYVGVGYRPRLGNEHEQMPYRIVAARDGTQLDYDPAPPLGAPTTMSAGEVVTFWAGTGDPFVVRTQDVDHPVYLAAYMTSGGPPPAGGDSLGTVDFDGEGDPEFVNVVPAGQYLNSYSFYADPTFENTSLVVVRQKTNGQFKDVTLDCAGTLTDFHPIGTRGEYEYVRVDLAVERGTGQSFDGGVCKNGLQRMQSDGAFTATLWGWATYASYAYPGGMAQRKLVVTPLAPIH